MRKWFWVDEWTCFYLLLCQHDLFCLYVGNCCDVISELSVVKLCIFTCCSLTVVILAPPLHSIPMHAAYIKLPNSCWAASHSDGPLQILIFWFTRHFTHLHPGMYVTVCKHSNVIFTAFIDEQMMTLSCHRQVKGSAAEPFQLLHRVLRTNFWHTMDCCAALKLWGINSVLFLSSWLIASWCESTYMCHRSCSIQHHITNIS